MKAKEPRIIWPKKQPERPDGRELPNWRIIGYYLLITQALSSPCITILLPYSALIRLLGPQDPIFPFGTDLALFPENHNHINYKIHQTTNKIFNKKFNLLKITKKHDLFRVHEWLMTNTEKQIFNFSLKLLTNILHLISVSFRVIIILLTLSF